MTNVRDTGAGCFAPRVLLVDDEPTNLRVLRKLLEKRGFEVATADGATEAIATARSFGPHLVLLDIMMPEVDGFEACRMLKRDPDLREIPVIFITALDDTDSKVTAFEAGGVDFVSKPLQPEEVLARVRTQVDLYRERMKAREYARRCELEFDRRAKDEEAGRKVQFSLLPRATDRMGDLTLRHYLKPSMYVSGDFVDYFRIGEQFVGLYMADVSGHGVASALVTVLLKSFVNKYRENYSRQIEDTILNPALLLGHLNDDFLRERTERHVAIFYGVFDLQNSSLLFANGGHFPFPILCASGKAESIVCKALPLGLFQTAQYSNSKRELPPDFSLFVFSDGVLDIMDDMPLTEKLNRLRDAALNSGQTFDELIRALAISSKDWLPDDIAVLAITRRTGDA